MIIDIFFKFCIKNMFTSDNICVIIQLQITRKGCLRMEKKNNTLIKVLVILGSLAAIFVAVALIYKKYNKKRKPKDVDPFDFDDDFFFDDCEGCYDGDGFFDDEDDSVSEDTDDGEELIF